MRTIEAIGVFIGSIVGFCLAGWVVTTIGDWCWDGLMAFLN